MSELIKPISHGAFEHLLKVLETVMVLSFKFKLELRKVLYETSYEKDARILNFGGTQQVVWFMLSGLLREIRINKVALKEKTSWYWLQDSFVYTDPGYFSQQPSLRAIQAEVDCVLVLISYQDWMNLKAAFTEVELITERIRADYSKIRIEHMEDMKLLSVDERYLDLEATLDYLFLRTQLNYIADFMGMAPATLGRLRTRYYDRMG
ncbi:Crp/Fnr family transcriptional regulator [Pedobacter hiemivivus]|uniref:Crp/Fnr family transcriptional regulator n=1 Tax=Pedobacter hiemivivus TaxID=2530454 RepID=A0A4V2MKK5_9SPHI|nr:hypothetical protein [Pedobacter hiemivivus]TCC98466.1 hypothetical protein EZ444_04060 [Pedobacter hiemivivus]